jgi:hypothetical protein
MTRRHTGRTAARLLCALALLLVARSASQLAAAEAPTVPLTAVGPQQVCMPEGMDEARLLLAARRPRQAAALLGKQLASMPPGPQRAIVEWYLALAESVSGHDGSAHRGA